MVWTLTTYEHDFIMPEDCQSFADFQDLDPKVREALVIFVVTADEDQALASLVQPEYIGMPLDGTLQANQNRLRSLMWDGVNALSMARCWAECNRDMILAKLTWSPDYR